MSIKAAAYQRAPSGAKASDDTRALWPRNVAVSRPVSTFQSRIQWSSPEEAIVRPSGANATDHASFGVCPRSTSGYGVWQMPELNLVVTCSERQGSAVGRETERIELIEPAQREGQSLVSAFRVDDAQAVRIVAPDGKLQTVGAKSETVTTMRETLDRLEFRPPVGQRREQSARHRLGTLTIFGHGAWNCRGGILQHQRGQVDSEATGAQVLFDLGSV